MVSLQVSSSEIYMGRRLDSRKVTALTPIGRVAVPRFHGKIIALKYLGDDGRWGFGTQVSN